MNAQSSRSHALLTITVQQKLPDGSTKVSKLNVADLAGSEKVAKTGSTGDTLEEAKKINASVVPRSLRRTRPSHASRRTRRARLGASNGHVTVM